MSVLLALVTLVLVGWTAWLRFGPASRPEPPAVGLALPPLRLLDLETAEPLVLLGAKGKVTWIVFWSAGSPSGRASLSKLEGVWLAETIATLLQDPSRLHRMSEAARALAHPNAASDIARMAARVAGLEENLATD
ncbi:MAG: hypothetical protein ACXVA6_20735 [Isosphaeraceae bacterium]